MACGRAGAGRLELGKQPVCVSSFPRCKTSRSPGRRGFLLRPLTTLACLGANLQTEALRCVLRTDLPGHCDKQPATGGEKKPVDHLAPELLNAPPCSLTRSHKAAESAQAGGGCVHTAGPKPAAFT